MPTKSITNTKDRKVGVWIDPTGFVTMAEQQSCSQGQGWVTHYLSLTPEELAKIQQYVAEASGEVIKLRRLKKVAKRHSALLPDR